jgi:catechol 2,3-dioxygenase-like lactoylglutathione lyase family enzyme
MSETAAASTAGEQRTDGDPRLGTFSHVSVPCRDYEEAKRFFINVLGAELKLDLPQHRPPFGEVRLGGTTLGFSQQAGGWTGRDAEFPHYAFLVAAEDFLPLKARLEAHGVPTHPLWTRGGVEALMYFRDPSGNLFELYCRPYPGADALPRDPNFGGDFRIDFAALNYDWQG